MQLTRGLFACQQAEQDAEVARIATEARLQQDNEYAATSACYQYSLTFVQGEQADCTTHQAVCSCVCCFAICFVC